MPENGQRSAGAIANEEFVTRMKAEHSELVKDVPFGCLQCSSGWLHASRGNTERLEKCLGRSPELVKSEKLGEYTVMLCRLPSKE